MIRKLRKGFTIVELVIVIAVIAVLTAVLIPTFVHLSKKANKASDSSLVANLNTALAMEASESGKAPKTMHEAVEGLKNQGYLVGQLVTKSEEKLVYSIGENKFFLSGDVTEGVDYWKIYKATEFAARGEEKFSAYAVGEGWSTIADLKTGFDAGEVSTISSISFVGGNDVIIRTNSKSTSVTIDAEHNTVEHYGDVYEINILAIDTASYHEYGTVHKSVRIAKGHFELENTGSVPTIVVDATSVSDVSVDISSSSVESAPVVYAESETVAAALNTIVEASQEVKESSIQTVVFTKHVTTPDELKAALKENGNVIVDNNMEFSAPLWISNTEGSASNIDHAVVLDLNGKTLSTTSSFVGRLLMNCVKLTVTGNGTITSVNSNDGYGAIRNFNELVIENGTFLGSPLGGGSAIDNQAYAKATINDGYFGGSGGLNNRDNGIAVVNGGRFITEACAKLPDEVYCYALRSSGKITINNAYVRGAHGGVSVEGGSAVINNVDSETYVCSTAEGQMVDHSSHGDQTYYALYVAGEQTNASCVVNGGHFKSNRYFAVLIGNSTPGDGGNLQKAFATINGGEFIAGGSSNVIKINGTLGFAYLYGGKYSNNNVTIGNTSSYHLSDICDPEMDAYAEGNWYVVR